MGTDKDVVEELPGYFLHPVQRICKYPLLLKVRFPLGPPPPPLCLTFFFCLGIGEKYERRPTGLPSVASRRRRDERHLLGSERDETTFREIGIHRRMAIVDRRLGRRQRRLYVQ